MTLDPKLVERVLDSPQLPSLPAIAIEIIGLVQQDEVDVDKIAETISLDPALSSKLLKTVNSSFYGLSKSVASVHQAVIVLGLNSVKTLALGFSLVNNLAGAGGAGFDHMAFWRRSLFCATAAKQLCDRLHIVQAEEVFMASLLQDVGVLAMAQVLEEQYAEIMAQAGGDHRGLSAAERAALGGDHTDIGGALAESWGLPPLLVESIRLHERPDEASENLVGLIRTVYAGALAAELIESPDEADRVTAFHETLSGWFQIDRGAADCLLQDVFKHASEMQRLFELPTGELGQAEDILARANRALESLSLEANNANQQLSQDNARLQDEAHHDALTGLANRRRFDESLDEGFLTAGPAKPLSVMFVDIDQLKHVNDNFGHADGDTVLKAVAQVVRDRVGSNGEVFRYGGDEFTVLCPGLARTDAAVLAESLRAGVEQVRCQVGEEKSQTVSASVSIGVATCDGPAFKRPEQLVKAADMGVAAAKKGGHNLVRVFVPRDKGDAGSRAA